MEYKVNDIIYTKDGRRSGNLTVVDVGDCVGQMKKYTCVSDYGNIVTRTLFIEPSTKFKNQYFVTPGKATEGHKYYNYKEQYPEKFI